MTTETSSFSAPAPAPTVAEPAPVIIRATVTEAAGAKQLVAGLTVFERSIRQLARTPGRRVIVATDGILELPRRIPGSVEVRRLAGDVDAAISALAAELGAAVVGADVVRVGREPISRGMRVIDGTAAVIAEDRVFNDLLRGDLGFVARHLNKKISFPVTRFALCRIPITPNQVTLLAAGIGLLGCRLIASGYYWATVFGFLLAQAQSILDGCDGELARVRFQQSRIGEWLDTLVDDFLNLALITSITMGLWHAAGSPLAIVGGVAAVGMFGFYNIVSYRELVRQGVGGELINIRWKLTKGRNMKAMVTDKGGSLKKAILSLGRRDTFVLGWLVLSILHLTPVALLWAVLAALPCFTAALAQVLIKEEQPSVDPGRPSG